ncbi:hypothetical protein SAMN02787118_111304 [Streptomyces mirabilis]|uniref:Uncharacterized protein n=1 Tax=Streptomyces mirabilis TaxID=68239 RepID=A0A1I2LDY5_9ACTN|nr:hypothetical protein SAMN02787118_111304 [Streptomyces mirabilis]
MNRRSSIVSLLIAGLLASAFVVASSAVRAPDAGLGAPHPTETHQPSNGHWVNTWVSMPQLTEPATMPPAPFTPIRPVTSSSPTPSPRDSSDSSRIKGTSDSNSHRARAPRTRCQGPASSTSNASAVSG